MIHTSTCILSLKYVKTLYSEEEIIKNLKMFKADLMLPSINFIRLLKFSFFLHHHHRRRHTQYICLYILPTHLEVSL